MAGQALPVGQNSDGSVGSESAPYYAAFARPCGGDGHELTLAVEGIHCAGCIQKVESAVKADPAVREARLNFSTKRLRIVWSGEPALADRLVSRVADAGYKAQAFDPAAEAGRHDRENRFLLLCLGVAGFAAGNIMLLSFALWTTTIESMGTGTRDLLHLISALIAIPAVAFSGRPFFYSALAALKKGRANMDVPISLALFLATGMSVFQLFNHAEDAYFDSAVMLMFFLLIGRYLDFQARARARGAAGDLLALMSGAVMVLEEGRSKIVPISALEEGMIIKIGMGERIPADGVIIEGQTEIDLSLITGESFPVAAAAGRRVHSGTLNVGAPVKVRIEKKAEDSFLADIIRLMEKAEQAQSGYVRLAEKVARFYTPAVHTLAAGSFIGWFFMAGAPWQDSLLTAITVLIITCPCALGLAVPVVQVLAVGRLMKQGILVKSGDALERLSSMDTVFLDKTGTLTLGRPALVNGAEISADELQLAASLAAHSRHPLSRALAGSYEGSLLAARDVAEHPGRGIEARYDGRSVRLGSRSWCGHGQDETGDGEYLELWLAIEGRKSVRFLFSDPLREDVREVLKCLENKEKEIYLLSGDRAQAVGRVAQELGIERYGGGMTPEDKYKKLESARAQGRKVLMIGDGLNDAPVLAGADVSMSPATAIDVTQNAADIVFTGDRLRPVLSAYETACLSQKLVKQNFMLSIGYNLIAVPLAVAGLVTPLVAAIAMSSSSLIVILNSFRLTKKT